MYNDWGWGALMSALMMICFCFGIAILASTADDPTPAPASVTFAEPAISGGIERERALIDALAYEKQNTANTEALAGVALAAIAASEAANENNGAGGWIVAVIAMALLLCVLSAALVVVILQARQRTPMPAAPMRVLPKPVENFIEAYPGTAMVLRNENALTIIDQDSGEVIWSS